MKRFDKLKKQNETLRFEIEHLLNNLQLDKIGKNTLWNYINELIENEIEQEELCNE